MVLVALLVLAGVVMIGVAIWLVRSTRTDAPALGPLEVMGERRWRRADGDGRADALTAARPAGAPPPAPTVAFEDPGDAPSANGERPVQEPVVTAHTSPDDPAAEASPET